MYINAILFDAKKKREERRENTWIMCTNNFIVIASRRRSHVEQSKNRLSLLSFVYFLFVARSSFSASFALRRVCTFFYSPFLFSGRFISFLRFAAEGIRSALSSYHITHFIAFLFHCYFRCYPFRASAVIYRQTSWLHTTEVGSLSSLIDFVIWWKRACIKDSKGKGKKSSLFPYEFLLLSFWFSVAVRILTNWNEFCVCSDTSAFCYECECRCC